MELVYNIYFDLAGLIIALTMYVFLRLQYSMKIKVNRLFMTVMRLMIATGVLDIVTAVTISCGGAVPKRLNLVLNTVYFVSAGALAYAFANYVEGYVHAEGETGTAERLNRAVFLLYLIVLVFNVRGGPIFYIDEQGQYLHGHAYLLVYVFPFYFLASAGVTLVRHRSRFLRRLKIAIVIFMTLSFAGPLLQLLVFPNVLLSVFCHAVALLCVFFSLETPDYHLLTQTLLELEKAKGEVQSADHAKTEFLKNMSHELRTPINAILGYDELIREETQESQTMEYAENVHAAGRALLSLVNDIMDFSGTVSGALVLEPVEYSTLSFLQDILIYTECNAKAKGLKLEMDVSETLPVALRGDIRRLVQIINNLSSNAVKYTSEGYVKISVLWESENENVGRMKVQVEDSGQGMSQENVSRITDLFSRLEKSDNKSIRGVGLGLSIVTKYLELMDSRLEIQTEQGAGSTFSFQISQEIVDAAPIGRFDLRDAYEKLWMKTETDQFTAEEARILAVDDNEMNLDVFERILRDTCVRIDTAANGRQALQRLEKNTYHMIFLDHMMPVLDGIETLKIMREKGICAGVPVIALTANTIAGAREMYAEAGFDDYLSKPVSRKQLLGCVKHYLPPELVHSGTKAEWMKKEREEETGTFEERFSFLDIQTGMEYCCDSEEFYVEMMQSYLESSKLDEMRDCYECRDWNAYRILVHTLKSTSLSIGAVELSAAAKELEAAAKEQDTDFLCAHHEECMNRYETLLRQLRHALAPEEKDLRQESSDREKMERILVVDDDPMNQKVAQRMLEDWYDVSCVGSGREALLFLEKQKVNLILLDLHMPEMDGFQVIRHLKTDENLKDIPVIFLTADNDRGTEVKGFQEGASDFITKPFLADIMIQRVRRILELDRLQKHLQSEIVLQMRQAEERRQKVERLSYQVILTLAKTIDAKDKYTNGHSERVARYSREIARRSGFAEREQEYIYYMALLHDIGKIGIPDTVLNKDSKLTDEEFKTIQRHPQIGADILKNISEIPNIELGALEHHERYDGRGYPNGISGEQISVQARIICVADAYDAMTSKRSYRDILPQEAVRKEIEREKGRQFDPKYADILLEMIDEDFHYEMRG